jgi:hypothetical protein
MLTISGQFLLVSVHTKELQLKYLVYVLQFIDLIQLHHEGSSIHTSRVDQGSALVLSHNENGLI